MVDDQQYREATGAEAAGAADAVEVGGDVARPRFVMLRERLLQSRMAVAREAPHSNEVRVEQGRSAQEGVSSSTPQ